MNAYVVDYSLGGQLSQAHIFAESPNDAIAKLGIMEKVYNVDEWHVKLPYEQVMDMLDGVIMDYHTGQFIVAALQYFGMIGR